MQLKERRILLVDDEPWNVEVLESFLNGHGYIINKAYSGEEALSAVGKEPPDIVLLDVMMPGMDGFDVCRRLKENEGTRFIPVVIITSLDQKTDRVESIGCGADDFLTKPVDEAELLARVRSLLRVKSHHDELDENYKELLGMQIMRENLVNMLVHDFRNPLTGIIGYLELLSDDQGENSNAQYVSNSQYLAKKMISMVSDLMDLTRLENNMLPLKLENVILKDLVEEVLREFGHAMNDKSLTALIREEDSVELSADRRLITRVAGNILANGIRHSPAGANITITTSVLDRVAELSFSNEGEHIPDDVLERIFEKFYQAEAKAANVRSGAGLGLAFCDMVVKAHAGSIAAVNNTGPGCRFIIRLPIFTNSVEGADGLG
jgi:signal transduction histidine kinase